MSYERMLGLLEGVLEPISAPIVVRLLLEF